MGAGGGGMLLKPRDTAKFRNTHTVHCQYFGPDEDKEWSQLTSWTLKQLQHVREDADRQGLGSQREEQTLVSGSALRQRQHRAGAGLSALRRCSTFNNRNEKSGRKQFPTFLVKRGCLCICLLLIFILDVSRYFQTHSVHRDSELI